MSSTNRSNARDSHISDYYVTPIDEIKIFIDEIIIHEPDIFNGYILDPASGGDINHPMSYPEALIDKGVNGNNIKTIDIREDSLAEIKQDYFTYHNKNKFDLIITNPPFVLAREYVEKSLNDVKENGWVIMLLRLNFLESKVRKQFFDKYMPRYIFVHHKRMSFTDTGKTDSVAYAHYVWQKDNYPEFSELRII